MMNLAPLVPLFPLIGFLVLAFFGKKLSKSVVGILASGVILLSFIISVLLFFDLAELNNPTTIDLLPWIDSGALHIKFSFLIDQLSAIFLLIITGIGFLIHVYSVGYMHDDEGFHRFFAYLNLFVFFMLLLVMGSNYLLMFVGWEGVGLCSYLLIGYWFKNTAYNNAAKKAFIINRIGDLGFLLGIILIFLTFGSIEFSNVFEAARSFGSNQAVVTTIALLLFIGAMGKSAQLPLYTWLPDAMAGPTPVSALIHAATMVTAGIYMIARSNIIYSLAPFAQDVVMTIGIITALFAATIGLLQNDIKKVLAYSTVSQLGYMFVALGVGAYTGAVFHVTTHAFFKALLFLGAGSVIHGMSGDQDIRNMGGLRKKMPVTYITFLIGTIAIAGIPPFAGFFSKDEILAHAFSKNRFIWFLGLLGSAITAFYMFRLLFLTFFGKFRGTHDQEHHVHESPKSMTFPLIVLAVLSVIGGFIGLPESLHLPHALDHWLEPVLADSKLRMGHHYLSHETEYLLMAIAVAVAGTTIYFAYKKYVVNSELPAADEKELSVIQKTVYNKYYVDEIYERLITKPLNFISGQLHRIMDTQVVDGIVNGTGQLTGWLGSQVRLLQNGHVGSYIFAMVLSLILILFLIMF